MDTADEPWPIAAYANKTKKNTKTKTKKASWGSGTNIRTCQPDVWFVQVDLGDQLQLQQNLIFREIDRGMSYWSLCAGNDLLYFDTVDGNKKWKRFEEEEEKEKKSRFEGRGGGGGNKKKKIPVATPDRVDT
jgi:hypothetical protein